ncbi:hypothetical protein GCM10008959_26410 [Deinococcus seoulensis]|uniref:Phage tail protein n=1 Tax=Deinococcus seoulensis TaxID=1837379 RepID=A0ABQ2RTI1_9DEIO|nr:hypothetical protein [Deinococcus seoulensis]GGR63027.1 hypothetical protein GCM10008959_26410 [Deinococcus seoulensis]
MKAKVTGVSAWQGTPTGGTLSIRVPRYVDSSGNATVEEYIGWLDVNHTPPRWMDGIDHTRELYTIVQGPDDPPGVRGHFYEVLEYGPTKAVRTEFTRKMISSDLDGLIFDYAAPEPTEIPVGFGDAPLTMRAAQQVIEEGGAVVSEWSDIKVDIAQAQALAVAAAGITPRANLAAITGADGYYRAMDTGRVYQRAGGINTPRPELEPLSRAGQTAVQPEWYDGTDLQAGLIAAIAALPAEGGTIDARKWTGTHTLTAQLFASSTKKLTLLTGRVTLQWNPGTLSLELPSDFHWALDGTTLQSSVPNPNGASFTGGFLTNRRSPVTVNSTAGSPTLTLSDVTALRVGDVLVLRVAGGASPYAFGTLGAGIGAGDTTIPLSGGPVAGLKGQDYYLIGSEIVSGNSDGTQITGAVRGLFGTTAAAHASGAALAWAQSVVGRVTAISGTQVTLDKPAALTLTAAPAYYAASGVRISGRGLIDGRKTDPDTTQNALGVVYQAGANCKLTGDLQLNNWDHGGFALRATRDCVVDVDATLNNGRSNVGSNVWVFGSCEGDRVTVRRMSGGFGGVIIDDRTTFFTGWGVEGPCHNVTVTVGDVRGIDPYGMTISGGTGNRITAGRVGAGIFANVASGDGQWTVDMPTLDNTIEFIDHEDAGPQWRGDAVAKAANNFIARGASLNMARSMTINGVVSSDNLKTSKNLPYTILDRAAGQAGAFGGVLFTKAGVASAYVLHNFDTNRLSLADATATEAFGVDLTTGQPRVTASAAYLNLNRKSGGSGGYGGLYFTDNLTAKGYFAFEWSLNRFVWLDSAAAVQASMTAAGALTVKRLFVSAPQVPASAAAIGTAGEISWDANYIYICVATNTWRRVALAAW